MKIFFTILLTLYANQSIGSAVPRFVITSNCISSIEVKESGYIPGWTLIVNLDNDAANDLLAFSKKYLKAQVRIIDGEGKRIIENDIVIQTPLSTTFHVMALESKNEALNSKKSILSTMGKCGEIKSK